MLALREKELRRQARSEREILEGLRLSAGKSADKELAAEVEGALKRLSEMEDRLEKLEAEALETVTRAERIRDLFEVSKSVRMPSAKLGWKDGSGADLFEEDGP